jgi:hypothetical protein
MTNYDVVRKLIGNIMPVGETNEDNRRFGNLESMCLLVNLLVQDIDQLVYKNKNSYEGSVKKAVQFADKFLKEDLGISE